MAKKRYLVLIKTQSERNDDLYINGKETKEHFPNQKQIISSHATNAAKKRKATRCFVILASITAIISLLFESMYFFEVLYGIHQNPPKNLLYGSLMSSSSKYNITSEFVATFEEMFVTEKGVTAGHGHLVPLILDVDNRKLLCRRGHKRKMSWFRSRLFMNMVRMGLKIRRPTPPETKGLRNNKSTRLNTKSSLPVLFTEVDEIYCNIADRKDTYSFPRLAWSTVSQAHQGDSNNWCHVIGMPSYETWYYFHRKFKNEVDWVRQFRSNEQRYPWHKKLNKAVWRGSTTYEGTLYGDKSLDLTPRGRLVKLSMDYPERVDAGFTKIVQKFEKNAQVLMKETMVVRRMRMSNMMRYKAIIDIDGNGWSSRFGMLLCMNSVVIKIEPDYVEYFYKDLQPMVHYMPATLQNLTQTVQYATAKANENEMRAMVQNANAWCQKTLIEPKFVDDSLMQLELYQEALNAMDTGWREQWEIVMEKFTSTIDDLVDSVETISEIDWVRQFRSNDERYPWHEKMNKAVWRGSTTYEGSLYGDKSLEETPRGQLVKLSMDHPELIDAGFTKINQKFATERKALKKDTRVVSGIWMNDMMKYKAIIDIDGNNWSSRFGMLLCMNSVVIKIEPDFIEYFYKDLQPMVHYIPAALHNLTETAQYVMDEAHEKEIRDIVHNANSWCQKTLIEPKFAEDAMGQLEVYQNALNEMGDGWRQDWAKVMNHFTSTIDDLVECDVKNIVSFLID
ncbi:hypothetical protein ACHAXS_011239 [Conticribra weissflogii]